MIGNCKNCRNWKSGYCDRIDRIDWMNGKIPDDDCGLDVHFLDDQGLDINVSTGPLFGCTKFEAAK